VAPGIGDRWTFYLPGVWNHVEPSTVSSHFGKNESTGGQMNQSFRQWLAELWRENCDEHDGWGEPRYTLQEYFARYKWWLKREYRYQRNTRRPS
jgi:hypothetical protein